MVVSENEGRLSGFMQLIFQNDKIVIDLIAVAKEQRRKHVANDMISFAEKSYTEAKIIRVSTQLANWPSIKLYQNLGFKLADSLYVFHFHL